MLNNISKSNAKVVEKYKIWFIFPILILLAGILVIIFGAFDVGRGLNLGTDFTGGSILEVTTGELDDAKKSEVTATVGSFLDAQEVAARTEIQFVGEADTMGFTITFNTKGAEGLDPQLLTGEASTSLLSRLKAIGGLENLQDTNILFEDISASTSTDLIIMTVLGLILASFLILVYITVRFEMLSGIAAIITQIHDVLIVIALVAIFQIKINAPFMAALITVLGYSINGTIIIFDRVRENVKRFTFDKKTPAEIANKSIMETLTRSINSSVTTLFAVLVLVIIGVPTIREFTLPIIFGIVCGTYSSTVLAPSIWVLMTNVKLRRQSKSEYQKQQIKTEKKNPA